MLKKLLFAAALVLSTSAFAQEKVSADTSSKEYSETAELLSTAGKLVKYGYQTKTALPLIQAVEIYNRLGVSNATEAKQKSTTTDAVVESATEKATTVNFDVKQLITDATKYADGDKNLLALISAAGETRGRVGGPTRHYDRINAGATDTYEINFRGGETAMIIVSGDGDTDLDLYVYDSNGNYIASDTDNLDDCVVVFTPRWTGKFIVKIKNLGRVYNNYCIATN